MRQQLDLYQQVDTASQQLAQVPLNVTTQRNEPEIKLADINRFSAQNQMRLAIALRRG